MKKNLSLVIVGLLCLSTFSVFAPQVKADSESIIFQDDFETFEGARAPELLAMFSYAEEMIDHAWSFPNGTTFTFRGWLQSKGFSVSTVSEAFPTGEITLLGLQDFQAILAFSDFFGDPANVGYIGTILDYVSLGGGLILLGQGSRPSITIDEAFGFCWSGSEPGPIDPWSFYVDAGITDYSHPIMQGITELPKAGGVFVDWDTLIDETPLPSGTAVLARTLGTGGPYDPIDRIAMIAFQYGDGNVVAGPWDGLVRPYGPTAVNPWDVIAEPIIENKLLINAINWIAGAGVITLPAGLWHPYWRFITDPINDARLDRIDLDSMTSGDQQVVTVGPGEEVTIDYSAWLSGNSGEIRQLWFVYSWASSYPPWDAYTPIYNGQPYPSRTVANSFSITTPTTPGTYKVWLCVQSQYNMNDAVADVTEEPTMLPHALITVCARRFSPIIDGFQFSNNNFTTKVKKSIEEIGEYFESSPLANVIPPEYWTLFELLIDGLVWMQKGYCFGMVHTAQQFFPDNVPSGYLRTHDIPITDAATVNNIIYNQWITSWLEDDYLLKWLLLRLGDDPGGLVPFDKELEWITQELDKGNPVKLSLFDSTKNTGLGWFITHAVLAYAYSVSGNNIDLYVYGPNYGNESNQPYPGRPGWWYHTDSEAGQTIHLTKDTEGNYVIVDPWDPTYGSFIEGMQVTRLGSKEAPTWGLTWATILPHIDDILGHVIEYLMEVATEYTDMFIKWVKVHLKDLWDDFVDLKDQAQYLWDQFVGWIMDNAKGVWNRIVHFKLHSAADLHVYDSEGMRVGLTPTGDLDLEFDALFLYTDEIQYCAIPSPEVGSYLVELVGTDEGSYGLNIALMVEGTTVSEQTFSGEIVGGAVYAYKTNIDEETMSAEPDPTSDLEQFKQVVDELTDDCFDQSIRRASHLKKALFNKIDEVILQVEAGNYTDAINKLFWDIRAKMDGDSIAEDWIIDSEMQFRLCVIIDHIISSIETL